MKAVTHDEKHKAEAFLKVDGGNTPQEHNNKTASDGAFCTWVPVINDQKLTITAACNTTTDEVQFDLIIDGILRNSVKTVAKERKNDRRTAKFEGAFIVEKAKPVDAEMVITDLSAEVTSLTDADEGDSVGTIEVRIFIKQNAREVCHLQPLPTYFNVQTWKDEYKAPTWSAIRPTQEIDLSVGRKIQPLPQGLTSLKKRVLAERIGTKPCAIFRFFYRTQDAITNAGFGKANKKHLFRLDLPPVVLTKMATPEEEEDDDDTASEIAEIAATSEKEKSAAAESDTAARSEVARSGVVTSPVSAEVDKVTQATPSGEQGNPDLESDHPLTLIHKLPHFTKTPTPEIEPTTSSIEVNVLSDDSATPTPRASHISPRVIIPKSEHNAPMVSTEHQWQLLQQRRELREKGLMHHQILEDLATKPKDEVDKHIKKQEADSTTITPEPEPGRKDSGTGTTLGSIAKDAVKEATAQVPTTPIRTTTSFKRHATLTPDTANKKMKGENDATAKKVAEMHKCLIEKRKARVEAQKKANDAEDKRKANLERMMQDLEAELNEEEELTEQAEYDREESERAAIEAARELGIE